MSEALDHVLRVTADEDSLCLRIECLASEGADCRLVCAEDCGAETYPCYSHDGDDGDAHAQKDGGFCNIAEWINGDCPSTTHQRITEPVGDGIPIITEWEGDYYSWRGATPNPVERLTSERDAAWGIAATLEQQNAEALRLAKIADDILHELDKEADGWAPLREVSAAAPGFIDAKRDAARRMCSLLPEANQPEGRAHV